MKKLALILVTLLMTVYYATAQEEDNNYEESICIGTFIGKSPEFPGGTDSLYKFLESNLTYPEDAKKDSIQGRVICRFTIDTDGSVTDIQVLRSVHPSLDAEAVRVLSAMPKWVPAETDGKKTRCKFVFPVVFKMDTDKQDKKGKGKKKNKKHIKQ